MIIKSKALEIMSLLKLHPNVLTEFANNDKLNRSETKMGLLYWLTDDEINMVKQFQHEHSNALVYHIIKTETLDFGTIYDLLYVTDNDEDLSVDEVRDGCVLSYTTTEYKESGLIKVRSVNGGLVREY